MATKVKALQMWCKKMAEGYRDVDVVNMTSSWKDGLAFCAIIHRFRPDLIDFDSLSKENVFDNNQLAFEVAEKELGIPAFLDASDMVEIRVPDKLSVVTYVSQYCNYFRDKPQLGGPGVKKPSTLKRHQDVDLSGPEAKRQTLTNKDTPTKDRQVSMGDKCVICHNKVYLLERHVDNGQLYHRTCFRSSELSPNSKLFKQSDIKSSPQSTVSKQTESPKSEPDFWKRRAEAKKMANENKVKTESDNKVKLKSDNKVKVESDKKVKVENEKVSEIKSNTKFSDGKDVTSKMSETNNSDRDHPWRTSRGDNLNLKKMSDDKEMKTAFNDASKNTSGANKYEKVEKWVPEKKKTEVSKSEETQPKPMPRNIFKMGAKEERVEEPMDTTSHLDKQERPKPVPRKNLNNIQTDKTEQRNLKTKQDLHVTVKNDSSDKRYTHNKTKVESNVKEVATDPESPPPLPKSIPPSLPSQPSTSPPQLQRNQPPHLSSGGVSSSSPSSSSSSHVSSTSNKYPEKTKTSVSISKTSQQEENHGKKKSSHFKFNLFGKKESHEKESPRSSKENVESSKSSKDKVEFSKSSKDKVESSKSSKDKVESSKSSKDLEAFKSSKEKVEPPKSTKEKVESPKSSTEKVVPSKEKAWSPNNRASSPKSRPVSVDPRGHTKMDVDDAIAFTKQSPDPVAVLMSPTETDKELLGGLLNNLAHIRKKKQDGNKKIGDTSYSKSVDVGQLLTKGKDLNKKEVKSWNGDEKVTRKDKTKSSDFVSSKLSVFGENKNDNSKPTKQEVKVDKTSKENKIKSEFYTVDDDDVPEWKKALERRKEAKRPKSVDILATSSSKTPEAGKVGQSRPDRPKSYDLLADKKTSEKPAWQIEAEKRMEARKGVYVDPEIKHIPQDTGKEKQNETNTKKNSQNLLLKDRDNQLNIKTTDGDDKTDRKSRILPIPPSSELQNTQEQTKKKIIVGQKFDFGKLHDDDDEDTTKVKGKPPRPPPISPGGPNSRESVSPFLAGRMANFTKSQSPSTGDEIKTFGEVKRLSPVEIQQQLKDIDTRLTNLEVRGRHLEDTIRKAQEEEEDEKLMIEWFKLVNEKNELVRKEADLIYVSRAQDLEDQQLDINRKIRMLMNKPDHLRTDSDKEEEEYLINKLLDIVNQRSLIVDSQDEDRIRYEEEDKDIAEILESKGFCQVRPTSALKKEEKILEKKKKKKKQKKGKLL